VGGKLVLELLTTYWFWGEEKFMTTANNGYAHPEALVSTEWVAAHLNDPKVRLVESNEDILLYDTGHIPGAVKVDWHADLNDPVVRDYVNKEQFEALMRRLGVANDTTVVFLRRQE